MARVCGVLLGEGAAEARACEARHLRHRVERVPRIGGPIRRFVALPREVRMTVSIQELLDREAIRDLLADYSLSKDLSPDLTKTVNAFHPQGTLADRKSNRGFGTMAREVIMCTGARSGDDSGHSIADCRRYGGWSGKYADVSFVQRCRHVGEIVRRLPPFDPYSR